MNFKLFYSESKLELISNVLTTKRYATIGIISGVGLGIIYYFLTMSMLPTHFDATVKIMPSYIAILSNISCLSCGKVPLIVYAFEP